MLTSEGDLLAVDAGGNTALEIDLDSGAITMLAPFEDRLAAAPPFLQLPPGTKIPMLAVPSNLLESADGSILVGELADFPFPAGGSNVNALAGSTTPTVVQEGFTSAMDLVEFAQDGLLTPGGIAADAGGLLHLTVNSFGEPGSGGVLRFDPSLAVDPAIQVAAKMGWVQETGGGNLSPFDPISRGQAASVLTRIACALVGTGHLTLPD